MIGFEVSFSTPRLLRLVNLLVSLFSSCEIYMQFSFVFSPDMYFLLLQEKGTPDFPGGATKIANTFRQPSIVKRTPRNFSSFEEKV